MNRILQTARTHTFRSTERPMAMGYTHEALQTHTFGGIMRSRNNSILRPSDWRDRQAVFLFVVDDNRAMHLSVSPIVLQCTSRQTFPLEQFDSSALNMT